MTEQTEDCYLDGEVVWVKLGSCWWPGEVVGSEKLPPDVLPSFRKPPIAVVKFFQEDTFEYVKNNNSIYKYNCSRKNEFINKGLYMYRTKHGLMEKFPEDVIRAETAVGGDITILTRDEFQETKKESYAGIFGDSSKTPGSGKKGKGKVKSSESSKLFTPMRKIKEKSDYKVHILVQGSNTPSQPIEGPSTPSTSCTESDVTNEKSPTIENTPESLPLTPSCSRSGIYSCHACPFSTTRLNVLILHNKTHSVTFTAYTPSPVRKKPVKSSPKSTSSKQITPKIRRPRKEKSDIGSKKTVKSLKRVPEDGNDNSTHIKKLKTDEEIKSSLLADWDDVDDEESNDEYQSSTMVMAGLPEAAVATESPAVPTSAELPVTQGCREMSPPTDKRCDDLSTNEKAECSSDSKYEFCEDEDWPLETDAGRKIPRVKNASKRKDDTKSVSLDDDEMAKEVAELLSKTAVPELPSVPESLKVEENFPEPSIVKSPDKKSENLSESSQNSVKVTEKQPTKAIFKTKTFFRSRHSRSQDAIGKYVAEQLNAVERMDMSENEINGSDAVSSPEARDTSPVEQVKVARLAPKIQLKKMKAEAAQMREKERINKDQIVEELSIPVPSAASKSDDKFTTNVFTNKETDKDDKLPLSSCHDVLYPSQEIKLANEAVTVEDNNIKNSEENNKENLHDGRPANTITITNDMGKEFAASEVNKMETTLSVENLCDTMKSYEQVKEPLMNESTASAVDALLSVSRDADRVTRNISNDPPEDLFEDDNKDIGTNNNVNGINDNVNETNSVNKDLVLNSETEHDPHVNTKNIINENIDVIEQPETNSLENKSISMDIVELPIDEKIIKNNHSSENVENVPSESDLQIAEALINLPATAIQNKCNDHQDIFIPTEIKHSKETILKTSDDIAIEDHVLDETEDDKKSPDLKLSSETILTNDDNINVRFETEQEKSENLNAAQSLVQMSESVDHKINIIETNTVNNNDATDVSSYSLKQNNGIDNINTVEQKVALLSSDPGSEPIPKPKFETTSSKLLKILEEPVPPKLSLTKSTPTKQIIIQHKEKNLNFDIAKSSLSTKNSPVIIRRTPSNKTIINNLNEISSEKIVLSRNNKPVQDASSVQTYTIQTASENTTGPNTITIIQQKLRKVPKTSSKLHKIKPNQSQNSLVSPLVDNKLQNETTDEAMFDINSMPIVLSDDLLTPESIEKMPIVMSDGNIISNTQNPPKLIKTKPSAVESDKNSAHNKPEVKTLLMNPVTEVNKITPNILSKSSKLRGTKPMLVIDKATGKQKIIVTKTEPIIKEVKQTPTLIQPAPQSTGKAEKFIILPTPSSPRPGGRPQKIVIDPQTGKAHVLVAKGPDTSISAVAENKPVSAKLIPSSSDGNTPGGTVMIITNAQGAKSRIVLTPEHEKMLFPNKQTANMSQLKTITHRISPNLNSGNIQKTVVTGVAPIKNQTRIVPKQKNAIITSKGQLIVGGRVATATQNIAPMPEIRPSPKRIIAAAEPPKKIIQSIQKTSSEPLIFLQQKSGTVVQLTASQFEHFQRTGQIIQKVSAPIHENKIIVQKTKTIPANEMIVSKSRARKTAIESPMPAKKIKHEIAIAPAPVLTSMPALAPISNPPITSLLQPNIVSSTISVTTTPTYPELENFEELLPSTAIVRQSEVGASQAEPSVPAPALAPLLSAAPAPSTTLTPAPAPAAAPPAPLSDGQLLAVPGEHFGGPQGSFYLCVEDNGTLTPIDNRPLVLENNQLVPMAVEPIPILAPQPERRDILEAALANSDVFHAETPRDEAPDFRDLNANVSVHCRVSETSTTLNQPIMTPVEMPTKGDSEPTVPSNLEDGLAVIGVTPHTVPTSLELPITVTDPRIAPKTTDPLSGTNYGTTLLPSPNTEMTFVTTEEVDMPSVGPISMPILTDEESVGKSMPILTDDVAERTVSSVESTIGSPSSIDVRESETEDGSNWTRRLLTPGSDTSETSAEIPLQPVIQLSANELSRHS